MTNGIHPVRRSAGCGLGCLTRIIVVLLFGVGLVMAINAVFAPWSYFMGGKFHILAYWQGWGRIHAPAGDYLLYVNMQPRPGTRGVAYVTGNGALCTPRGETFNLRVGADFEKNMGSSTDGKHVYMWLYKRPPYFFGSSGSDDRPHFELHGAWHNPDMVLDDHGTLSHEFGADGRLYDVHARRVLDPHNSLAVTIKEGTRAEFDEACKAAKVK